MKIALGVTGGIAAYKACEVVRGLTEAGASVQVLMTRNAERFITPLTLQALSGRKVWTDTFDASSDATIHHVDLARDLDAFVVAPATANVLGKLAHGIADDLLSTFYLAVTAPVVVAPAMNTRMWLHPATQDAVIALKRRATVIVPPEEGWLAERETGVGRLAEPARIVAATLAAARRGSELAGRKIVVTAGPTREPLDPVRYLSNGSSGKMGYALAAAAARRGAEVVLVSGPVDLPAPFGARLVPVSTAREMRDAVLAERPGSFAIFMVAAVSDYAPVPQAQKIKKTGGALTLVLDEGPDILAELGRAKGEEILVGFAAETDAVAEHAAQKLAAKNADFIVANDVSATGIGIGSDRNAVTILGKDGGRLDVAEAGKAEIAEAILDRVLR
ncbi:MAG TPA: bifunctional phosphopantothenoylcysteine decarboxylase/phosphopantothenate--cysteine ligase CoaBC [Candidatus Polarisedimenticolaceae bacterium]|nr:bifunctional phosphopantothenoylcysteine decarboxylase/phosphopantothenate--cysteine ligase CoaBC [Candidatus Polarisedimenticolaceae bacterium]